MPRSALPDRVVGVYPDGAGARLVCIVDGRRTARRYPSRAKAEEAARTLTRELSTEGATVKGLAAQWVASLTVSATTHRNALRHLRYALGPLWEWPLSRLTARTLEAQADGLRGRYAAASLVTFVSRVREWTAWLHKKRLTKIDLGAQLEPPKGGVHHGKPQLRIDEGQRLLAALLADPSEASTLLLCCLLLGLRRGEALALTARDLDLGGTVLVIERGKTRAAARRLLVPAELSVRLQAMAARRAPGERLATREAGTLARCLDRHLAALGLPHVCLHSLRGLHATAAREAGATAFEVMATLGHKSRRTQEQSYLRPGTGAAVEHRRALRVLTGGR